jgi:light-regulated signal transduction histidine kinase (bacteriophytochrome)
VRRYTRRLGLGQSSDLQRAVADPRAAGTDPLVCHLAGEVSYDLTWHRIDGMIVVELEPSDLVLTTLTSSMFSDVRHAMDLLQSASGVLDVCGVAAAEIAHLTGYDRVMVYRFHPDGHGEVVAEQRDPAMAPFLGLHYPASDIPRQARKLYLLNQLRVITDIDYEPVPLLNVPGNRTIPSISVWQGCAVSPRCTLLTSPTWECKLL